MGVWFSPEWLSAPLKAHHPPKEIIMLGLKFSQTPYHLRLFREEEKERAYSEGHTVHNLLGVALKDHPGGNGQTNSHVHL